MVTITFMDILAACIAANAISFVFLYVMWAGTQLEKQGKSASELPWLLIIAGLVPSAIVLFTVIG